MDLRRNQAIHYHYKSISFDGEKTLEELRPPVKQSTEIEWTEKTVCWFYENTVNINYMVPTPSVLTSR